jgi:hypothetical protein
MYEKSVTLTACSQKSSPIAKGNRRHPGKAQPCRDVTGRTPKAGKTLHQLTKNREKWEEESTKYYPG